MPDVTSEYPPEVVWVAVINEVQQLRLTCCSQSVNYSRGDQGRAVTRMPNRDLTAPAGGLAPSAPPLGTKWTGWQGPESGQSSGMPLRTPRLVI